MTPTRRTTVLVALTAVVATAALVGAVWALVRGGESAEVPWGTASEATARHAPTEQASQRDAADADAGVALLADPAWVADLAERTDIPERALAAYAGADLRVRAEYGCEIGWNSLAGIGYVETEHGTLQGGRIGDDGVAEPRILGIALDGSSTDAIPDSDGGEIDGDPDWDRAVGPMQFIPQTWGQWGTDGSGDGVADIDNIDDAALTAARYLCEARGSMSDPEAWIAAVRSYNDSGDYQRRVADAAAQYAAVAEP